MPMNVGALRALVQNIGGVNKLVEESKQALLVTENFASSHHVWLWRIAYIGWSHPLFLSFIAPNQHLTSDIANFSKLCHGVLTLLEAIGHDNQVLDSDYLYQMAESTNALLGIKEACAAPKRLITSLLDEMLTDTADPSAVDADWIRLIDFCRTRWALEYAAMIFEWARCTLLYRHGANPIVQRYAFPYARKILRACTSERANIKSFTSSMKYKRFEYFDGDKLRLCVAKLEDTAGQELSTVDAQLHCVWMDRMSNIMIDVLNECEERLVTVSDLGKEPYRYSLNDLRIFFGPLKN